MSEEKNIDRRHFIKSSLALSAGAASLAASGVEAGAGKESSDSVARPRRFEGKVVVITGATSGMGRVGAIKFAAEGAKVFFNGRRAHLGQEVEKEIRSTGGEATYFQSDVRKPDQLEAFFEAAVKRYGQIDVGYNNAGIANSRGLLHERSLDEWNDIQDTNLRGVFLCMQHEIRQMLKQPSGGAIINVASVAGHSGLSHIADYSASKHGVAGLTRVAGKDYAKLGIRVNAVSPAGVRTPMLLGPDLSADIEKVVSAGHPVGRIAQPEEIVDAVMFLASQEASFMFGETMMLTGGLLTV